MAGRKKNEKIELDEFDDDIDDLDIDAIEDEAPGSTYSRKLTWQRLEQRADSAWLSAQLADWDEYLDIH